MADLKAGARRRPPTHPGAIVKRELEALGLTVYAVAPLIGVTRAALGNLVGEKSAISTEMALRLGAFFGNGAELWMGLQTDVDLWNARARLKDELARIKPAPREADD